MHRLDSRSTELSPSERRADAQRLQDMGVTPLGAHQAMHGKAVTDPQDRAIVAGLIHRAVSDSSFLKI